MGSGIEQVVWDRGHGRVCEGDLARVGVGHGMMEVKLLCYKWLSPFLKHV